MGNSPSRYDETNWETASGGLTKASETVDGSEPTSSHVTLTIAPKSSMALQKALPGYAPRAYNVKDAHGQTLYTTVKVPQLERGFDLLNGDGTTTTTLLRVDATYSNRTWHIFSVGTPVFEGQHPDPHKAGDEALYRKASVLFAKDTQHMGEVTMFVGDDQDVCTLLKVERCTPAGFVEKQKWHFQTFRENDSDDNNLVGYWKWEGSPIPQQMVMDVAKDADLALHVILAVMTTIERSSVRAEYTG